MPAKRDEQTYAIIGAAMEVHKTLGYGFLETVYQEALTFEFKNLRIPFQREVEVPVYYKTEQLATCYKVDFICFQEIIVELKALKFLSGTEESQVINYLKATGLSRGLLLNFGTKKLDYKRMIFSPRKTRHGADKI